MKKSFMETFDDFVFNIVTIVGTIVSVAITVIVLSILYCLMIISIMIANLKKRFVPVP